MTRAGQRPIRKHSAKKRQRAHRIQGKGCGGAGVSGLVSSRPVIFTYTQFGVVAV